MFEFNVPAPITPEYDLSIFDCGSAPLNEFLLRHALDKQNAKLSRTYVIARGAEVVAYYTLAHVSVAQAETPKKFGRGMPSTIPVLLIAWLAVDLKAQGHGLGTSLVSDALRRSWKVMDSGAAPVRLFIVDAKDIAAKTFYERFEMTSSPFNPLRLFLSYKTLASIFAEEA